VGMHAIYAVSVNPALDLSGHVSAIVANEKNYVHASRIDPGGNAVNAARVAHRLGGKPLLLGFLGGSPGLQLKQLLKKEGLQERFTRIEGSTRINVTVTNDANHQQTRLTFPGPSVKPSERRDLLKKFCELRKRGLVLLGGSACSDPSFYPRLIQVAQKKNWGLILDIPSYDLKPLLNLGVKILLIKPNQSEFEVLVGKKNLSYSQMIQESQTFSESVEMVCISLGGEGLLCIWRHRAWLIAPPKIKPRGTVGAGDSVVGALASFFAKQELSRVEDFSAIDIALVLDAMRLGVAAGAATAMGEGTSLASASLVRALLKKTVVSELRGAKYPYRTAR
jgi:1-phosphofructokinase family hexose kinase